LYSQEWNIQKESIQFGNADFERISSIESIETGLEAELHYIGKLIHLLEKNGNYSIKFLKICNI